MCPEGFQQAPTDGPNLDVTVSTPSDYHLGRWRVHTACDGHLVHLSIMTHEISIKIVNEQVTGCAAVKLTVDRIDVYFFHPVLYKI